MIARKIDRGGTGGPPATTVTLDYDGRFLRRKSLTLDNGSQCLVDLAETVSLAAGDHLITEDGAAILVRAAPERVTLVRADSPEALARLAWHIGNRHTPCQIGADFLVLREDHVLDGLLRRLGARLEHADAPFTPEGGAYGLGRIHGHDHGHDHGHGHAVTD